jgi:hypothetical protein
MSEGFTPDPDIEVGTRVCYGTQKGTVEEIAEQRMDFKLGRRDHSWVLPGMFKIALDEPNGHGSSFYWCSPGVDRYRVLL